MANDQITTAQAGSQKNISIISLRGFIDLTTAEEVERLLSTLMKAQRHNIIVDLRHSDYISSSIWGIFLEKNKKIREQNGDLKLANMKPDVLEVYKVLELFRVMKSFDTLEDAIEDFLSASFTRCVYRSTLPGSPRLNVQ